MKVQTAARIAMAIAVALATIDFDPSWARGGRGGGGGFRGGGGMSRGGGGFSRGGGIRGGAPTSIGRSASRGSFAGSRARAAQLPSTGGARPRGVAGAIGNTGTGGGRLAGNAGSQLPGSGRIADAGNRPTLPGNQGGLSGNRGDRINGGNRLNGGDRINNGNRINTGDINIDNSWNDWGGWVDHPVAAGVVAGAAIGAATSYWGGAYGSYYYDVPPGCPPYYSGGYTYYSCGGAYYQPQYEGDQVVYVNVPDPAKG